MAKSFQADTTARKTLLKAALSRVCVTCALVVATACSVDPTEETVAVQVNNDRAAPVVILQCGETCKQTYDSFQLSPGACVTVNGSAGVANQYWEVKDSADGQILGCVNLKMPNKHPHQVVHLSVLVPCGSP